MQPLTDWDYNAETGTFMTAIGHCLVVVWQDVFGNWNGQVVNGRRQVMHSGSASFTDLETWVDMETTMLNANDRRQRER